MWQGETTRNQVRQRQFLLGEGDVLAFVSLCPRRWFMLVELCLLLAASGGAEAQAPAVPPPAVTVMEVRAGRVPLTFEYAARIAASRVVEVRAQAGGILLKRNYVEGQEVKAGDVLFEIDPKPYEAERAVAEANLKLAQARLSQASRAADRTVRLAERGTVSEKARDDALSARELAAAEVAAAEAQVKSAQLNVGYTEVKAPISGVTGQEQVPEGSLISTGADSGLLTTITQLDPLYVNFSVSETEFRQARALLESQGLWQSAGDFVRVEIKFGDGSTYPLEAKVDFASSGLDLQTGTLSVRAVVGNPERRLLPGQFVRAIVTGISVDNAIVVPHEAVMQGPQGQFVYTVDAKGNAEMRPVELGREVESGWIVKSGLNPGDRLITEGIIKVRPGAPVTASVAAPASGAQ
jgi:membrane fusion protein (multidrug efflux system)